MTLVMLSKTEGVRPEGRLRFRWVFTLKGLSRGSSDDMGEIEIKAIGIPKKIIDQIDTYISQGGGEYEDWFIGITDSPIAPIDEVLLLHKMQNQMFMYIETISQQIANAVADYFVNECGIDGNLSRKDTGNVCRALYVYKKAVHLVV